MSEETLIVPEEAPKPERLEVVSSGVPRIETSAEQQAEKVSEQANEKYAKILSLVKQPVSSTPSDMVITDANALAQGTNAKDMVEKLMVLAETKGVAHAVNVAKKLSDFYILDLTHDRLADEFYDALKAKGLVTTE